MTFARFGLVLGSLLVAACGPSVDAQGNLTHTPPPNAPANVKEACAALIAASEKHDARCGAEAWSDASREAERTACETLATRPDIEMDLAQAAACASAIPASWCSYGDPLIADACAYLKGTSPAGGSCQDSDQCVTNLCLGGPSAGACGVCGTFVGLGEACDDQRVCDYRGTEQLTCTAGKCALAGTPPGGACTSYGGLNDCIGGFYCKANNPNQGVEGTCVARPTTGNACGTEAPCIETNTCVFTSGGGSCKPSTVVATGGACDDAARCSGADVCVLGICKTPAEHVAAGGTCDEVDRCAAGLVCSEGGLCQTTSTQEGAPCPCDGDLACVGGACVARKVGLVCHGVVGGECGRDLYCKVTMPPSAMLLGTCAPRVAPGADCSFASSFEQTDICFSPYFCGSTTGVCEVADPICQAP